MDCVIERKAAGDLQTSIKDRRYVSQKMHMRGCGQRGLMYLIEGDLELVQPESDRKATKTASAETEIYSGAFAECPRADVSMKFVFW